MTTAAPTVPEQSDADVLREAKTALAAGGAIVRPGDLFGPGEAAAHLGVNRTTVSRWCRDPRYMPPALQRIGGADVWTRAALDEFAARHAASSDAAGRRPLGSARPDADA